MFYHTQLEGVHSATRKNQNPLSQHQNQSLLQNQVPTKYQFLYQTPESHQRENENKVHPYHQHNQNADDLSISEFSNDLGGRKKYSSSRSVSSSISSRSSKSDHYPGQSPLDDPTFAPPPEIDTHASRMTTQNPVGVSYNLPSSTLVTHSGNIMARISTKEIILKKWKQVFWITYGDQKFLIFRSKVDFEEWINNPYLTPNERDDLLKFSVDFKDFKSKTTSKSKGNTTGYRVSSLHRKDYGKSVMNKFQLEEWFNYGPRVMALFSSKNQAEVKSVRMILIEMMKRYKHSLCGFTGGYDSDVQSVASTKSAPAGTRLFLSEFSELSKRSNDTADAPMKSNLYNQSIYN